jgi:hypothetical protein
MVTKEQLIELESKHKRIAHIKSSELQASGEPDWEIVIRKPNRAEYTRFRAQSSDPSKAPGAQEELVRQLSVHPTGDALSAMFEDFPGIAEACGAALAKLAGIAGAESAKF